MRLKKFKVYVIKNNTTDSVVYAGITRSSLKTRFYAHKSRRGFSYKDYRIELISDNLSTEQAITLEEMLIKQYRLREVGWNKSPKSINGYSNYHSEEQKAKWQKERKGVKVSSEHAEKNRTARLGKTNSKAHNLAISKKVSKAIICLNNGKTYKSAREAAKDLDLSYSKISNICNGKRTHTKGYKFKFLPSKQ